MEKNTLNKYLQNVLDWLASIILIRRIERFFYKNPNVHIYVLISRQVSRPITQAFIRLNSGVINYSCQRIVNRTIEKSIPSTNREINHFQVYSPRGRARAPS